MKELIAVAQGKSGQGILCAHPVSAALRMFGELHFQTNTGTRFQFVPYRGRRPALQDVCVRADRSDLSPGVGPATSGAQRQYQSLCNSGEDALGAGSPTFQPSMRRACPGCTCRSGMAFGRPRTRPGNIIARLNSRGHRSRWAIRRSASDLPISDRRFSRASSRRPRLWPRCRKRKSKSGGRSSRPPTSESKPAHPPVHRYHRPGNVAGHR